MQKINNMDNNTDQTQNNQSGRKWKVLISVIFGIFMVILDTTVVNVAFQAIRDEFGGDINTSQWVISIYVLVLGITTPLAGFLADRFGAKKVYLYGLGLFAAGSFLCGLSNNLGILILARAVQGMGGGLAMPLGIVLLFQTFPVKEHGKALGFFGIAALVAPAVGPILGGWLVDQHLWRVIFFINPPIGLLGIILGIQFLGESKKDIHPRFDVWGMVSEVIGFGAILYATSIAADFGWTSPTTLLLLAVGVIGLIIFGIIELRYSQHPLMDLRLFKNQIFLIASLLGYVSTIALFGAEFLMPIYLQALRGLSALQTGFVLLPMAVAGGIFITYSGRMYDRWGPRPLLVAGFSLLVINTWQLSRIQADTPILWIVFLLILRGFALGLTVQNTMVTALSVVAPKELARGSSLTNSSRLVVQSIGVAVLATILAGAISPEMKTFQDQFQSTQAGDRQITGLCEISPLINGENGNSLDRFINFSPVNHSGLLGQRSNPSPTEGGKDAKEISQACQENINGFEASYTLTFFASLIALILSMLLPGWPGRWNGRQESVPPEIAG